MPRNDIMPEPPPPDQSTPAPPLNLDPDELAKFEELARETQARIEAQQADPSTQQYFMRLDKRTVIESETEFTLCVQSGIPIKIVSYNAAVSAMQQAEAKVRAKRARRKANRRARKSRKANRVHA